IWRRERDSNPRYPFGYSGFQDRPFRPLTHPSAANKRGFSPVYNSHPCVSRRLYLHSGRTNGVQGPSWVHTSPTSCSASLRRTGTGAQKVSAYRSLGGGETISGLPALPLRREEMVRRPLG